MYCTSHCHKQKLKTNVKVYCVGHVFINNVIKMRNTSLKKITVTIYYTAQYIMILTSDLVFRKTVAF